jgi:hypothetical protein
MSKSRQSNNDNSERLTNISFQLNKSLKLWIRLIAGFILFGLLTVGIYYSYLVYFLSPSSIANPTLSHHHFRLQIIIDGEGVDFSKAEFQEDYVKGVCTGELTQTPIHFHDFKDQFVHIHWANITGGQVLKYYGLNLIGGNDQIMGYQTNLDGKWWPQPLPIRGQLIPVIRNDQKIWVYAGDENGYESKSVDSFLDLDLESFFGVKSGLTNIQAMNWNLITPLQTLAHSDNGIIKQTQNTNSNKTEKDIELSQDELKDLNNLIGNVVIFIQNNEPSDQEIKDRFDNLVPLEQSVCGG